MDQLMIDKNKEIKWETVKEGCKLAALGFGAMTLFLVCPVAVLPVVTSLENVLLMTLACKAGDELLTKVTEKGKEEAKEELEKNGLL